MKKRISLGILVITIFAIGLTGAIVYYQLGFRQRADVAAEAIITVYTVEDQEEELEQGEYLDWGTISSGEHFMDLWIKNTGEVSAFIGFNYNQQQLQQWGWTETWDYDNTPLEHNELRPVIITLELPADIGAGHYEWNAGITAYIP